MNTQTSATSTSWQGTNMAWRAGNQPTAESVLDFWDLLGTGTYRMRGADTLTLGLPREWLKRKGLLTTTQRFGVLGFMPGDDFRDAELAILLQNMAQQQIMLHELAATRPESRVNETGTQFVVAIRDALAHDQPVLARTLSQQGHRLYPQDERLGHLATILAPPKVVCAELPTNPDVGANMAWIKAHRAEYAGQWVAVATGDLKGVAPSLHELKATIGDLRGMLVTRVL
jgi:hypothetical protein